MEATIERLDGIIEALMAELEARHDLKTAQALEITVRVRTMYASQLLLQKQVERLEDDGLERWEDDETEE